MADDKNLGDCTATEPVAKGQRDICTKDEDLSGYAVVKTRTRITDVCGADAVQRRMRAARSQVRVATHGA